MTLDKSDGGGTSVGPLGFWLIDVRSLHETPPMVSAAQTLRVLYRIVAPFLPSGYGRSDTVKPKLRAVGSWPFSTPCRLPVSNVVSGSIVGCLAQSSRLWPTSAKVAPENPRNLATDVGSSRARRASRSLR